MRANIRVGDLPKRPENVVTGEGAGKLAGRRWSVAKRYARMCKYRASTAQRLLWRIFGSPFSGIALVVALLVATTVHAATLAPITGATGTPHSVTVAGSEVVIAGADADNHARLWVVDVTPGGAQLLGTLSTSIAAFPGAGFLDIALNPTGTLAIAAVGNQGLWVVDLSNPANPHAIGTVALPGLAYALDLNPGATVAYVVCGLGHLQVVSLTDPMHPAITASLPLAGYDVDIGLAGNFAYILNQNGSLHVVDVSGAAPVFVSEVALPRVGPNFVIGSAGRGAILSVDTIHTYLDVLDLSNPSNPTVSGSIIAGDLLRGSADISLVGNVASVVLPGVQGGVQVYDISSGTPVLTGRPDQTLTWIDTGTTYAVGSAPLPLAIAPIPGTPATPIPPAATPTPTQTAMATATLTATLAATATRSSTPSPIPATPTNTARPTACTAPQTPMPTVCA